MVGLSGLYAVFTDMTAFGPGGDPHSCPVDKQRWEGQQTFGECEFRGHLGPCLWAHLWGQAPRAELLGPDAHGPRGEVVCELPACPA